MLRPSPSHLQPRSPRTRTHMASAAHRLSTRGSRLKRTLRFRDLVLYGIILIQPTAPMPSFGVIYKEARGHVVTAILLAMVAMLFTSISYGRMARVYPHGGSAFLYVGKEIHPSLGYHHRLVPRHGLRPESAHLHHLVQPRGHELPSRRSLLRLGNILRSLFTAT